MVSEKQKAYKAFNKCVKEFMKDLRRIFPDLPELGMLYAAYKLTRAMGESMPHRFFKQEAAAHDHALRARDLSYFQSDAFRTGCCDYVVDMIKRESAALHPDMVAHIFDRMIAVSDMCIACTEATQK